MTSSKNYLKKITSMDLQQQKWIGSILICIICLVACVSIIPPVAINLLAVKKKLYTERSNLKTETNKLKTLMSREGSFEKIRVKIDERKKMFFNDQEASLFLKELNKLAEGIGGRIVLIKPMTEDVLAASKIDDKGNFMYTKFLVQVQFSGNFTALLDLLEIFKMSQEIIGVEEINISPVGGESRELNVHLVLGIHKLVEKIHQG